MNRADRIAPLSGVLVLAAGLSWFGGAAAADLVDPGPPPSVFVPRPAVVVAPVGPAVAVVPVVCPPGYARDADGRCLRTDLPKVACDPGGCTVLPPDPLPYGIGPALRRGY